MVILLFCSIESEWVYANLVSSTETVKVRGFLPVTVFSHLNVLFIFPTQQKYVVVKMSEFNTQNTVLYHNDLRFKLP